ncbi:hypothetical protein [Streptomyces djakartensis]|uniref:Uncharacterized protein n=1 Tax=Streptomyces djakartensis TaxID=68193 RepID=A0ABQ2Z3M4_9ACTN|nr:hypothetical protein [Streptomyces djakartensis]GGY02400.1 hypothetical protein GCM10010384_02870 [Streptomyces djakartensis]
MGERQSEGGLAGHGPRHALLDSEVEALIVASLVRDGVDAEAERRAVAAFRIARGAGARTARTRRRDDWRPREGRHLGRSLRTTLGVLLASLTLGGVAVAAIGVAGSSDGPDHGPHDGPGHPPVSSSAPRDPARTPSRDGDAGHGTGSAPARPDRPAPARDTEAHCRAYQQADGRGRATDATAWRRLVDAAGGESKVTEYCARQLAPAAPEPKPNRSHGSADMGSAEGNGTGTGHDKDTPARPNGRSR